MLEIFKIKKKEGTSNFDVVAGISHELTILEAKCKMPGKFQGVGWGGDGSFTH